MFRSLLALVAVSVIASLPVIVAGQAGTPAVAGVVKDQTGAVIPGATVRVINESTGTSVDAVTDGQGAFRTAAMPPGAYRVETTLDGFETDVRRVVLAAGANASIDVSLAPARFSQSVVVTARRVEELAQEVRRFPSQSSAVISSPMRALSMSIA